VIRGREPADTEPLFAADEVQAGLRIDSFWGRKVSLNDLLVQRPQVHIRIEKNGASNVPVVQGATPRSRREKLCSTCTSGGCNCRMAGFFITM